MTTDDARTIVLRCLDDIAPGTAASDLEPDADLRTALDLDSMDIFNLVAALSEETGIDIPDRDVGQLATVEAFAGRLAQAGA